MASTVMDRVVDLTPKEKQIFELLIEVVRCFSLRTQLRVAGGWVRDKLLGKESNDIDIALENMSGSEFCNKLNQYLSDTNSQAIPASIGVIKCNAEKSKHLETATVPLFGVSIDFVNLRAEDYTQSSRIPTMRFGTAEEDAYRRDLTINSLFYNIHDERVEDLTGRGIEDLMCGRIVTPLDPKQTFMDDPLRVLRAIRFGARFGFELDEKLKAAASDKEVVAAIEDKISRERIGHEVALMVNGNQPVKAMEQVCELQLFGAVFRLPWTVSDGYERSCVASMDSASKLLDAIESRCFTVDQRRLCLYGALFLPLRGLVYEKSAVVSYIFRDSLKLKVDDAKRVTDLHVAAERFLSLIPHMITSPSNNDVEVDWKSEIIDGLSASQKLRVLVGWLLKEQTRGIKEFWRPALLLCMVLNSGDLEQQMRLYKMAEDWVLGQGLDNIWKVEPVVDGNKIARALNIRRGPLVGKWTHKVSQWQLAHPSGTEQECIDWMIKQAKV